MDIGDEEQMMRAIAMSLEQSFAEVTGQAPLEVNWGFEKFGDEFNLYLLIKELVKYLRNYRALRR